MLSRRALKQSLKAVACGLTSAHFYFGLISSSLFLPHQLISISISSALFYFWLLHAQPAQLSISDVLFLASACTASILALVSSQLNRAQLGSGHGMTGLPTILLHKGKQYQ